MRKVTTLFIFLLCISLTAGAMAQESALNALTVLEKERGNIIGKSLLQISGEAGDPYPISWTVASRDAASRSGIRLYEIAQGSLVGERTPLRDSSVSADDPLLDRDLVKMDSDKVFQIVNKEAVRRKIRFQTINYILKTGSESLPVWEIKLFDNFGAHIVNMQVSASSGEILAYTEIDPDARRRAGIEEDAQDGEPIGGLIGTIRDKSQEVSETAVKKTRRVLGNVQEFLTGRRTLDED